MTGVAIVLVLLSAVAHASWNYLIKRAGDAELFTWWMAASANIILLPLAAVLLWLKPPEPEGWIFIAATWWLHLVYFLALSRAYRDGDLSLVYPVARGTGLVLIPVSGVLLLGESISALAVAGIALVAVGIFALSWWGRIRALAADPVAILRVPGIRYALLTGLVIAAYSTVDKEGVDHVTPMLYMYFLTSSATLGLLPVFARGRGRADFALEWRLNGPSIVVGGLLQFAAYALVLAAFQVARVSYAGPFREVGLLAGVALGVFVLREPFPGGRMLGAALIAAGAIAIAIAP